MIAIGGTIGAGLFIGSGTSLYTAGPAGALVSYSVVGVFVFFVVSCLGEMATLIPISGSFNEYASRFVDPSLGFALGINYWLGWALTL
jgi:lysine-specific permease